MKSIQDFLTKVSYKIGYPIIRPRKASIGVTNRCNAHCIYCVNWKNSKDKSLDPPTEKLRKLLFELRSFGVRDVMISGGEPFLRDDIFDLLEYGLDLKLKLRIITNGVAIPENRVEELISMGLSKIGISLDSLNKETLFKLRGVNIERVLRTIELLASTKESINKDVNVAIYTTVCKQNISDLINLATFAKERTISIQFQPVHFAGTKIPNQIINELWPDDDDIHILESEILELIALKQKGYLINSDNEFLKQMPIFFLKKTFYPDSCYIGYTDITIDQDLEIRPCWGMGPTIPINEVSNLKKIWYSKEMQEARKKIKKGNCPGCLYSCHLNNKKLIIGE